jgi:hypothetical protein
MRNPCSLGDHKCTQKRYPASLFLSPSPCFPPSATKYKPLIRSLPRKKGRQKILGDTAGGMMAAPDAEMNIHVRKWERSLGQTDTDAKLYCTASLGKIGSF